MSEEPRDDGHILAVEPHPKTEETARENQENHCAVWVWPGGFSARCRNRRGRWKAVGAKNCLDTAGQCEIGDKIELSMAF